MNALRDTVSAQQRFRLGMDLMRDGQNYADRKLLELAVFAFQSAGVRWALDGWEVSAQNSMRMAKKVAKLLEDF